jgi:hypothetical protein
VSDVEHWATIPGFDGWYEVSDRGRVRSWRHTGEADRRRASPRVLRGIFTELCYHVVKLTHPVFGPLNVGVHQLVLAAFIGPRPHLAVCDHINATPSDNRVANLRWITAAENVRHAANLGHLVGRHGPRASSPLDEARVRELRALRAGGASLKALAATFDVSTATVSRVVNGVLWKEVAA